MIDLNALIANPGSRWEILEAYAINQRGDILARATDYAQTYALTKHVILRAVEQDSDHDGLPDDWERVYLGDLTSDGSGHADGDGLTDLQEFLGGTNPNSNDSDDDGLDDAEEIALGTNPNQSDTDQDGLSDGQEKALGTDPRSADTDGDGVSDGAEVAHGTDPKIADAPNFFVSIHQNDSFAALEMPGFAGMSAGTQKTRYLSVEFEVSTDISGDETVMNRTHVFYPAALFESVEADSMSVSSSEEATMTHSFGPLWNSGYSGNYEAHTSSENGTWEQTGTSADDGSWFFTTTINGEVQPSSPEPGPAPFTDSNGSWFGTTQRWQSEATSGSGSVVAPDGTEAASSTFDWGGGTRTVTMTLKTPYSAEDFVADTFANLLPISGTESTGIGFGHFGAYSRWADASTWGDEMVTGEFRLASDNLFMTAQRSQWWLQTDRKSSKPVFWVETFTPILVEQSSEFFETDNGTWTTGPVEVVRAGSWLPDPAHPFTPLTTDPTTAANPRKGIYAVRLLPVDITVRKKGEAVDPDGVLVKKGDVLEIALAPPYFDQANQFENLITWEYRQLRGNKTWGNTGSEADDAGWTSLGAAAKGTKFEFTTNLAGVFQLRANITSGSDVSHQVYLRKRDDPYGADSGGTFNEIYRKGKPDYYGVADDPTHLSIAQGARAARGMTNWEQSATIGLSTGWTARPGKTKCNIFVMEIADHLKKLWYANSYPPRAYDLWNSGYNIPSWAWLGDTSFPEPGMIVSRYKGEQFGINVGLGFGHGHCGILDYDGAWINAGSKNVNRFPHITTPDYQSGTNPHFRK